ncbi:MULTISPECIES: hypothetical protein [unclassified Gilliamella]|uniref:hypothetical protein n=1 Tax=unclassified Gilliamella TaxID=2685620 RepID=UPI000A35B074|nr:MULTISPECIES: hypothetical protein [unclassified Gilliamella]OTQ71369.1 hypothetical protein B6C99_12290 [Gilliamella sp. N-G2]OTQ77388.1 hypothetical protein B6D23_11875 [Gilliamella sp. N-W3]
MQKIICFIMLAMLQFSCDNSPLEKNKLDRLVENIGAEKTEKLLKLIDQADDEKFNISKNDKPYDLDDEKKAAISLLKQILPIKFNDNLIWFDIEANGNTLVYKTEVKGITKEDLLTSENIKNIGKAITEIYCQDNAQMKNVKKYFSEGIEFMLYIEGKKLLILKIPADCKINR